VKNRHTIFTAILLAFACFVPLPRAQAISPAPDGGYPGGNTAEGQNALLSLTSGTYNTAVGLFALLSNTDTSFNTAIGAGTLLANTAEQNTAIGAGALLSNTAGDNNTADGTFALFSNTTGGGNTAIGAAALLNNTEGLNNNAVGGFALYFNTIGQFNNAHGGNALQDNVDGIGNNAFGSLALVSNVSGSLNTAIGDSAGTGITTGNNIIAIGAGVSGVSTVGGEVDDSCYIGNIHNAPIDPLTAQSVAVDADGKLGTMAFSSQRFKKEIKPIGQTSQAVLALKPVTFKYKNHKEDAPQFGLIAEEVAKVNADLVVHDKNGEALAVRYDAVTAMLLNEFLKEHKKVQNLEAQLKEQAAQIQKVSEQLELSKPARQIVLNN
jgi:hypothetical protein